MATRNSGVHQPVGRRVVLFQNSLLKVFSTIQTVVGLGISEASTGNTHLKTQKDV